MRCIVCGSRLPLVARAHKDPYCSRLCFERAGPDLKAKVDLSRKARFSSLSPKTKAELEKRSYYASFRSLGFKIKKRESVYTAKCNKCGVILKSGSLDGLEEEILSHFENSPCSPVALEAEEYYEIE